MQMHMQERRNYQGHHKRAPHLLNISGEIEAAIEANPEIWFSARLGWPIANSKFDS
jgi:hypothetical protein